MKETARKWVGAWLVTGVVMTFIMVIIGGVTRLTGSGLSIVEWNVIMGAIPPIGEAEWQEAFDQYKQFPQYELMNSDMDLQGFKFIFFWEYFHRLWGRLIGIVFIIPLYFFFKKKWLDRTFIYKLVVLFVLGGIQGLIGWIMVKSGLQDMPWVAPYKLTLHLSTALLLYGYLIWLTMDVLSPTSNVERTSKLKRFSLIFMGILVIQIFLGGMMSGMKAGLFYPTFPKMNGDWIPPVLLNLSDWDFSTFFMNDRNSFAVAFIQFFHRITAYLLVVLAAIFWWKYRDNFKLPTNPVTLVLVAVLLQATIGVITVLSCKGHVPVFWGSLHQAGALVLFSVMIITLHQVYGKTES